MTQALQNVKILKTYDCDNHTKAGALVSQDYFQFINMPTMSLAEFMKEYRKYGKQVGMPPSKVRLRNLQKIAVVLIAYALSDVYPNQYFLPHNRPAAPEDTYRASEKALEEWTNRVKGARRLYFHLDHLIRGQEQMTAASVQAASQVIAEQRDALWSRISQHVSNNPRMQEQTFARP